jgi:hypothetical protein
MFTRVTLNRLGDSVDLALVWIINWHFYDNNLVFIISRYKVTDAMMPYVEIVH